MSSQFYIGRRLSYDRHLCTVRYVGEVQGTKGEWLGIEWDEPERGKHSGERDGIQYFQCVSKSPTAASFVRPNRPFDPPRTFVQALRQKYASEVNEGPAPRVIIFGKPPKGSAAAAAAAAEAATPQFDRPIRISGKEVEEVGFDKIRRQLAQLQDLRIVLLDSLLMSRPISNKRLRHIIHLSGTENVEDPDEIKKTSPKIVELDLSRNLFEEWREIGSICEELDHLKNLRVDGNRFHDLSLSEEEKVSYSKVFNQIKSLSIGETLLKWEEIITVTSLFTNLTTFSASKNAFGTLPTGIPPATVTELTLESNDFQTLSDLSPLTKLNNLRHLVLKKNSIAMITSAQHSPEPLVFSKTLSNVDLSYNKINSWQFIEQLQHVFPGLVTLRVSNNPLYQDLRSPDGRTLSADDGYMLTLARIGPLTTLNYSPITLKERQNAEMYYLSLITKDLVSHPESEAPGIIAQHPRFSELCKEYGDPVIRRDESKINPDSLAARLTKFTFKLAEPILHLVDKKLWSEFTVEIPKSFTMYTAMGIVGKHFGLPPLKLRLVWETGNDQSLLSSISSSNAGDGHVRDEGARTDESGQQGNKEVLLPAGTRLVGTLVDGAEATIRVELKDYSI